VAVRRILNGALSALVAAVLLVVMAFPAWAADAMTLTFVRHGQSTANEAGVLNTKVPGPNLTPLGSQQAQDVAAALAAGGHDGIYASTMVRTQQTAAPLAATLGQPVVVLPGLQEIGAGVFEGSAERGPLALIGYAGPPLAWTFGLRAIPILGSADSGNAFDARVDGAVKTIYDAGDRNPVVYSHGATIMFWVMMNVDNPDPFLILTHPLDNTDVVVVTGTPDDGWTLTDWDGIAVNPNPSLFTRVFVAVRDVVAGLQGGAQPSVQPTTGVSTLAAAQAPDAPDAPEARLTATEPSPAPESSRKAPKLKLVAPERETTVAPNGATDLSDGNMATPGTPATEPADGGGDDDQGEPTAPTKVETSADGDTEADAEADAAAAA